MWIDKPSFCKREVRVGVIYGDGPTTYRRLSVSYVKLGRRVRTQVSGTILYVRKVHEQVCLNFTLAIMSANNTIATTEPTHSACRVMRVRVYLEVGSKDGGGIGTITKPSAINWNQTIGVC
jgi:hypothetical protein